MDLLHICSGISRYLCLHLLKINLQSTVRSWVKRCATLKNEIKNDNRTNPPHACQKLNIPKSILASTPLASKTIIYYVFWPCGMLQQQIASCISLCIWWLTLSFAISLHISRSAVSHIYAFYPLSMGYSQLLRFAAHERHTDGLCNISFQFPFGKQAACFTCYFSSFTITHEIWKLKTQKR